MEWIIQLPLVFFSVIVHELAHGWAAFARGDKTAEERGRLTLNPLPHIDPFGTVFLPLFCHALGLPMFGWAKPVPVDASRLSRPRDMLLVAAAGPLANLALAFGMALLLPLASSLAASGHGLAEAALQALRFGVGANLLLAFFNLLPVHPLDGSRVLSGFLPVSWRARYELHAPYGPTLLFALLASRLADPLVVGPSRVALSALARAGLLR